MNWLRAKAWQAGTVFAGLISLVLTGFLISTYFENRALSRQRDQLQLSITDPHTGYVARLAQATANVATVESALKEQNRRYNALSAESRAQLAETKANLARLRAERDGLQRQIAALLNHQISGETLEERVMDVDGLIMQEIQK